MTLHSGFMRLFLRILKQDAQIGPIAPKKLICLKGAVKWESMSNQGLDLQPAVSHHIQYSFEISLGGPADESTGIILSGFVCRIVSSGPIGAGHLEGKLFLIEVVTGQFETGNADENDAAVFCTSAQPDERGHCYA